MEKCQTAAAWFLQNELHLGEHTSIPPLHSLMQSSQQTATVDGIIAPTMMAIRSIARVALLTYCAIFPRFPMLLLGGKGLFLKRMGGLCILYIYQCLAEESVAVRDPWQACGTSFMHAIHNAWIAIPFFVLTKSCWCHVLAMKVSSFYSDGIGNMPERCYGLTFIKYFFRLYNYIVCKTILNQHCGYYGNKGNLTTI
jgi:hypothetical protein